MDYYRLDIRSASHPQEVLLAFLSDLPFDAFEEQPEQLCAFLPVQAFTAEVEMELAALAEQWAFSYQKELIPSVNWNAEWEANFQPIRVDDFCVIRADFHPSHQDTNYEIIINPRMAFGTGHHETTYMMIKQMAGLDFGGKQVLDYGCGTGILAILAAQMGAAQVDAIDIEEPAYENSLDNAQLNGVAGALDIQLGGIERVEGHQYEVLLANINRNVILQSLPALYRMMKTDSLLLISGILVEDEGLVGQHLTDCGFSIINRQQRNNWLCMSLKL
ncbi:MAG: 50S ribosomal protein L11 methyltransferase [Bacteroidota bacterium]